MMKILLTLTLFAVSGLGLSDGRVTGLKVKDGKLTGRVIGTDPIEIAQVPQTDGCPDGSNICSIEQDLVVIDFENCSGAVTAGPARFHRVGNVITGSGVITVDCNAGGLVIIDAPLKNNIFLGGAPGEKQGSGVWTCIGTGVSGKVNSEASQAQYRLTFDTACNSATDVHYTVTYED